MRRWRVYYGDGSTFADHEGGPEDAPAFGVVAIVQSRDPTDPHAPQQEIQHRWDWYFWEPNRGEWWGCDLSGLLDRLLHNLPTAAVKQGRSVPSVDYRAIMRRAADEGPPWDT